MKRNKSERSKRISIENAGLNDSPYTQNRIKSTSRYDAIDSGKEASLRFINFIAFAGVSSTDANLPIGNILNFLAEMRKKKVKNYNGRSKLCVF
jgi:hypothetical protein